MSDKFIALFSHFIACGTYEGVHILDGLIGNESDIRPDTIHGDTQAQNCPVFALAYLLGIKLMPRIRGIRDLNFYRPDGKTKLQNIDALFTDPINWYAINTGQEFITYSRTGTTGVDARARHMKELDDLERTSLDFYAAIRSLYRQRRADEIRNGRGSSNTPTPGLSGRPAPAGDQAVSATLVFEPKTD